jgi:hypothetical protein
MIVGRCRQFVDSGNSDPRSSIKSFRRQFSRLISSTVLIHKTMTGYYVPAYFRALTLRIVITDIGFHHIVGRIMGFPREGKCLPELSLTHHGDRDYEWIDRFQSFLAIFSALPVFHVFLVIFLLCGCARFDSQPLAKSQQSSWLIVSMSIIRSILHSLWKNILIFKGTQDRNRHRLANCPEIDCLPLCGAWTLTSPVRQ